MMNVATQAATRLVRPGGGVGEVSATQSVPFQNDIRSRLHSVARPAHGAPWLCGPASRRVCHFVEAGRRMRSAKRQGGRTGKDTVGHPLGPWTNGCMAPRPSDYEEPIPTDLHLRRPIAYGGLPEHNVLTTLELHARLSTDREEAAG
jgi:hypothetical protein